MTDAQEDAFEMIGQKYTIVTSAGLPDGRVQVEVANGATPYLFIAEDGEVIDEDGYAVHLP
jgi:hypothetical protein